MSQVRGEFSGRWYDPERIGIPVQRRVLPTKIELTEVEQIELHIERFGPDKANDLMVRRLSEIARGQIVATRFDLQFYAHELRELERYVALGFPVGQPPSLDSAHELWNNAHTATMEEYGVRDERAELYHPDAQAILRSEGNI